jgi:hypothetical protein
VCSYMVLDPVVSRVSSTGKSWVVDSGSIFCLFWTKKGWFLSFFDGSIFDGDDGHEYVDVMVSKNWVGSDYQRYYKNRKTSSTQLFEGCGDDWSPLRIWNT